MTNNLNENTPEEISPALPWMAAEQVMTPMLAGILFFSVVSMVSLSTLIGLPRNK
jgi:hypothetical protein